MEKYAKLKTKKPKTGQGSIKGVAPNRGLPPLGKEGKQNLKQTNNQKLSQITINLTIKRKKRPTRLNQMKSL